MKNHSDDTPLLTKFSNYKSTPKWTLTSPSVPRRRTDPGVEQDRPSTHDPNSCIDRTSKFRRISSACSFGRSSRFSASTTELMLKHAPPGPGQYSPPPDYSRAPYTSISNITFGSGGRLFPKFFHGQSKGLPSPSDYDIRGKHRNGGSTFDLKGVTVNNRHGWFYDSDVKSRRDNPAPGAYNPHYPKDKSDRKFTFGCGDRPPIHTLSAAGLPSPGRYEVRSTLGGEAHSFTTTRASFGSIHQKVKDHVVGPLCGQPTQFG